MIRIIIAEDQILVLGALVALLNFESDIEVVAQAGNGQEALELVKEHKPDVLISDIEMPIMTGLELANAVKDAGLDTKIIIVTTFARAGYLRRALDTGVRGYLLKDTKASELADAIRRVQAGSRVINPELALAAWAEADPLTDRERQVLRYAGEGKSSKEIAELLDISDGTVRNYLSEIISKLGTSNRVEAARLARKKGWL
ncbi:MAG TPA: response regulator transcription factor [Trueperaceae bacterium]|nr:response regulator transcription factor [Trueperaceae bacterium]